MARSKRRKKMSKGKGNNQFILLGLLAIVVLLGGVFTIVLGDSYEVYDDFSTTDPAFATLSGASSNCQDTSRSSSSLISCDGDLWDSAATITTASDGSGNIYVSSGEKLVLNPLTGSSGTPQTVSTTIDASVYDWKTAVTLRHGDTSPSSYVSFNIELDGVALFEETYSNPSDGATVGTEDFNIEIEKSSLDNEKYFVTVNGGTADEVTVPSGDGVLSFTSSGFRDNNMGQVEIDYVAFREFDYCDIESDEVWFEDVFTGSQEITIDDLSHKPLGYCIDQRPALIQTIGEGSRSESNGEITNTLRQGESVSIASDQVLYIQYVVDYNTGWESGCTAAGFGIDSTGACVEFGVEEEDEAIPTSELEETSSGSTTNDLVISSVSGIGGEVEQGTDYTIEFRIDNDLGTTFNDSIGGWILTIADQTGGSEVQETQFNELSEGRNTYTIDLDTSSFGEFSYSILPFVMVQDTSVSGIETDRTTSSAALRYNFEVVSSDELGTSANDPTEFTSTSTSSDDVVSSSSSSDDEVTSTTSTTGTTGSDSSLSETASDNLPLIVVAVVAVLGLVYLFRPKKKKG
jgi:hypothetical protein